MEKNKKVRYIQFHFIYFQSGKSKKQKIKTIKIKTDKKSRLEIKSRSKIIIPETPLKTGLASEDSPRYDNLLFPEQEEESMF